MAADVVGYSRLMANDEAGTLAALKRHREAVFNPIVSAYGGRIVKLMGDGTLVEFASIVDAVNCAITIQRAGATAPAIVLRIGINLGDVIIDGDDLYGDGINIAARLEALAREGGVCISSIVKESVGDRSGIALTDGGEVQVKNIDRPLKVWHWHPDDDSMGSDTAPVRAPEPAAPSGTEVAQQSSPSGVPTVGPSVEACSGLPPIGSISRTRA